MGRQAQNILFESPEACRLLFERSANPTLLIEGEVFTNCNKAALRAFRRATDGEMAGLHPWDCSPKHQPDGQLSSVKGQDLLDATLREGTTRFEWVHQTSGGEEFWVDVSLTAIPIKDRWIIHTVFLDISERKQAEQALKSAEEKYRDIFENAVEGILQSTIDGRFLSANPFLARMYGYESPEELMESVTDIASQLYVDPQARAQFMDILKRDGSIKGYETERYRKDGSKIWVSANVRIVKDAEGNVLYSEGTLQDITARKRAEEALLMSQLQLSEAMDLARIVHWELDPETGAFLFNDPFYTLYGTSAEHEGGYEMVEEEYERRFVHPDDMGLFQQESAKGRPDMGPDFFNEFEYRIIRRDGEERQILTRIRTSRNATTPMNRCFGTNQDITERKQTEKTLRESEERYRVAIEHSNDGVAIVRGNEHVFVNRRFLTMFGYDDPKEILGTRLFVTVHPDDYERVMGINRTNKKEEPVPLRYEFKGMRRDGTVIHVEVSSTKIVYEGKPAILAYLRDITERVRAEEMLRQSQKMEAIGTLSSGIAHDFNNILTAILGFADLGYEDAAAGSKVKRYLLHVVTAAQRGKDLVTQILSFSRKNKEELKPTMLAPVVKESVKMLRASLPKTIEIQEDITTEPSVVFADAVQIQQIIMNLGANAAHAMGHKKGLMKIGLSCLTGTSANAVPDLTPGAYLKLSVTDTGTGMEKDVLERVFDPFFTTKNRGEGTGLGLWVVHSIVENHKGAITVTSVPGQGSTFDVFLPRIEEQRLQSGKRSVVSVTKGHGHILIVDDETELVALEIMMAERLGYSATGVSDTTAALDLFRQNPHKYDLVLTDQTMPGMTGIDLARELISIRSDIPVMLITGHRDMVDAEAARDLGIRMVVAKPMTMVELGLAIKQAFTRQQGH
jgi:PAS domain S-box-containing protein